MDTDSGNSSDSSTRSKFVYQTSLARRWLVAAAYTLAFGGRTIRYAVRRRKATRKDWNRYVRHEGRRAFCRMYRMNLINFNGLLQRIIYKIKTVDFEMATCSSGSTLCPEICLAMTLR